MKEVLKTGNNPKRRMRKANSICRMREEGKDACQDLLSIRNIRAVRFARNALCSFNAFQTHRNGNTESLQIREILSDNERQRGWRSENMIEAWEKQIGAYYLNDSHTS